MSRPFVHAVAALGVVAALAACGSDNDSAAPGPAATAPPPAAAAPDDGIPSSAFGSVVAFVDYLKSLVASEADEPRRLDPDAMPPVDDSGGPVPLS
jgi:hypothetical protein